MKPEEKAKYLIEKLKQHTDTAGDCATGKEAIVIKMQHAKEVALIFIDEIIKSYEMKILYEQKQQVINYWGDVRDYIIKY